MGIVFSDFGRSKLTAGIAAATAVPFTMSLVDGTKFTAYGAGQYEYLVLKDASLNREIIKVTARTGNAFTVSARALGGTMARDWAINDLCEAALTAEGLAGLLADTTLTGNTILSNLGFAGTGARITADFGNGVFADRALFKNSVLNGNTTVGAIPNGTGNVSQWQAINSSDPANCSLVSLGCTSSAVTINSSQRGSGVLLPINFLMNESSTLTLGILGQLGIGGAVYGTLGQAIISGGASAAPAWTTIDKAFVGLGNVDNTSNATERAATAALTNKTVDGSLNTISNLTTAMFAAGVIDTDILMAANSATRLVPQSTLKSIIDNALTGLFWKTAVLVKTTGNITLSGEQTIDGVLTNASRVLVASQSTASQNGIYVSGAGAWTRATDMDTAAEFPSAAVFVEKGTVNADTLWNCTNDTVTVGTTAIVFVQFGGAGSYSAGVGLQLSGNQFLIDSTVVTLTGVQTLTNKTFVAPALGTPASGNASNLTNLSASQISGVIPIANLALGTSTGAKFLRDDGVLAIPPGSAQTIQRGVVTLSGGTGSIVYSPPFSSTPIVVLTSKAATTSAPEAYLSAESNNGFTIVFNGTSTTFNYIAIGPP